MRRLLPIVLLGALLVSACRDGTSTPDFSPQRDTLPAYPGADVVRQGAGPLGIEDEFSGFYQYDRGYFVAAYVTHDDIVSSMREQLTAAGWQEEDPGTSRNKAMREYCERAYIACASFVKEGVRAVITAVLPLQLNPVAPVGTNYHAHLEKE